MLFSVLTYGVYFVFCFFISNVLLFVNDTVCEGDTGSGSGSDTTVPPNDISEIMCLQDQKLLHAFLQGS